MNFMGIIDFIQDYSLLKQLENSYKSHKYDHDPLGVSIVEPGLYANRFYTFIEQHVGWFSRVGQQFIKEIGTQQLTQSSEPQTPSVTGETNTKHLRVAVDVDQRTRANTSDYEELRRFSEKIAAASFIDIDLNSSGSSSDNDDDEKVISVTTTTTTTVNTLPISAQTKINTPLKEGFLVKRGDVRRSWKRRWFSLTPSSLSYYQGERKGFIKKVKFTNTCQVQKVQSKKKSHCFQLIVPDRIFLFSCVSDLEREQWITAFEQVLDEIAPNLQ